MQFQVRNQARDGAYSFGQLAEQHLGVYLFRAVDIRAALHIHAAAVRMRGSDDVHLSVLTCEFTLEVICIFVICFVH